ncbi:MAG: hypothetical protein IPL78_11245 [Chloroflexi bacterium]|nr:hypothetical protein [Chloroflexota bacterium]
MPNSYLGQHQHQPKGRQKRINRELKDLVMQGMPGNVEERAETHPEKRYYPHGKEAARVAAAGRGLMCTGNGIERAIGSLCCGNR